jgi:hypothetical protein
MLSPALSGLLVSLKKIDDQTLTEVQRAVRHELELLDRAGSIEAMRRVLDRALDADFGPVIARITYGPDGSEPCQFCNAKCS